MSIIKFTTLPRDHGIMRKYGEFWFLAAKGGGMSVNGRMTVSAAGHGDREMEVMGEEALACSQEAGLVDGGAAGVTLGPWLKRGAGLHPKAGPFIVYKADGLLVKVTGKSTEITANPCTVPGALAASELVNMFHALIGDRDEVRVGYTRFKRTSTEPEHGG